MPKLSKPVISYEVYDGMMKLPGNIDSVGLSLIGEITTELVDSLLTDSLLFYYNFVGKSSGVYVINSDTVGVEIMQFTNSNDAYGYFAYFREDGAKLGPLPAESYAADNKTHFVLGAYVINLSHLKFEKFKPLTNLIMSQIESPRAIPPYFILFPFKWKVVPSGKYIPYNYLDVGGINQVFTTDYLPENGQARLTLFLMMDENGAKYKNLLAFAKNSGSEVVESPKGFEFDQRVGLAFEHPEHGIIVAGLIRKKLVGAIGFDPKINGKLVTDWVKGLK